MSYAKVTMRVNWGELKPYIKALEARAGDQSDWMRKTGHVLFRQHQRDIWNKFGRVEGSPVYWPDWGRRYGKAGTWHDNTTGLSALRMMIRKETGTWTGNTWDILRETNAMKNSVGPQYVSAHNFQWGVSDDQHKKATVLDQMWNVEQGGRNIRVNSRIQSVGTSKGVFANIVIPARPFVFATEPFATRLAENLATWLHSGIRAAAAAR